MVVDPKITWKSLSPIFGDVMVSPWNLLVGGLLINYLPTDKAIVSIFFGYFILATIFIFYGGLGFKKHQQSADILGSVFGSKLSFYLIPAVLALGQIGWAAINMDLGGRSLAEVIPVSPYLGITAYFLILLFMATLNLHKMGIVKSFVMVSSAGLMIYLFLVKFANISFLDFIKYQPEIERSLFWGVSIVVASLISFSTVTPDFFKDVKSEKDVILSTIFGLYLPGIMTALLGCFIFFDRSDFDLVALISSLTFPLFPNIFNAATNTDGAIAIYTPGLKFEKMFKINLKKGITIAGFISFILALLNVSVYLENWLKILSILFPAFIGIILSCFFFKKAKVEISRTGSLISLAFTTCFALFLTQYFPTVLISLVTSFAIFWITAAFRQNLVFIS